MVQIKEKGKLLPRNLSPTIVELSNSSRTKFDSGAICVIAENKEKYISFNVSVDEYKNPLGKVKQIKRQLQFINVVRFMASS